MPLDPAALSPLSVFGDGMRIIGTEVQPGLYSVSGGGDCEWGRLGAFTGNYDDKLGSGFSYGRTIVEILDTDMGFVSNECGEWTPLDISALSPVFNRWCWNLGCRRRDTGPVCTPLPAGISAIGKGCPVFKVLKMM